MKKLLCAAAFLLVSVAVLSARRPASAVQAAQGQAQAQSLEARVATLESDLATARARLEETRTQLDQTLAYLDKQSKAAQKLAGALDEAEQQGFAVGENWHSRQTLLAGMRSYCGDQQTGVPKPAPAAPAAKPTAPVRQARK